MNDPFEQMSHHDFLEALDGAFWSHETRLHTPTWEAVLKADGTLYLSGAAMLEGFSAHDVQALTRFLSERVSLPPVHPLSDGEECPPTRVEETESE